MLNYLSSNTDILDEFDMKILDYLNSNIESVFSSNLIVASLGVIIGLIGKLNQSKIFKKLSKLENQLKTHSVTSQISKPNQPFRNNKYVNKSKDATFDRSKSGHELTFNNSSNSLTKEEKINNSNAKDDTVTTQSINNNSNSIINKYSTPVFTNNKSKSRSVIPNATSSPSKLTNNHEKYLSLTKNNNSEKV